MGSKPGGSTTTTVQQTNPAAEAQLPELSALYGAAGWQRSEPGAWNYINQMGAYENAQATGTQGLAGGIMPAAMQQYQNLIGMGIPSAGQAGQLTANAADAINQGLNYGGALSGVANQAIGQSPYWQNQFAANAYNASNVLGGYGGNAINQIGGLAPSALTAGNPAVGGLYGNAAMALANPALSSGLSGIASGRYISPSTNPAYAGMIQAATQPLINQYQTATAPQLASQFEGAGRYGSGAATNAMGQAQYGLGQGLANAISGITNNAYNTGLNATLGAGQALGGLYNTGISNITSALGTGGQLAQAGVQNAGNLLNQAYQTGGNLAGQGYNTLNAMLGNAANTGLGYLNAGLTGLGAGATAAQQGYGTANTGLTGAGNMLNLGASDLTSALQQAGSFATYPESQYTAAYNAPWLPLSNESSILGGAIGGSGTTTTSQPYFTNPGADILSGLSGGLGIASKLAPFLAGLSDRRFKRDISKIGTLRNGLPLYSFRFVGSTRMRIGLMADEVEQVHPEAVIAVGRNRVKMVDYAKAIQ